jgi:hypothetical protein
MDRHHPNTLCALLNDGRILRLTGFGVGFHALDESAERATLNVQAADCSVRWCPCLDASADEIAVVAQANARLIDTTAGEIDAIVETVRRALQHPLWLFRISGTLPSSTHPDMEWY